MKATPRQFIAAGLVADNGVAPAPGLYTCTYGTTATVAHPATGKYDITLDEDADAISPGNAVKAIPNTASPAHATVTQTDDRTFRVNIWNAAGQATDAGFYFEITQLPTTKQ